MLICSPSLTGTEALIEFIIDMYRSTFLCLLELVVRGGLAVVITAVSDVRNLVFCLAYLLTNQLDYNLHQHHPGEHLIWDRKRRQYCQ